MKKTIQFLKCSFGNHEWVEEENVTYDPEYKTKKCLHCNKMMFCYKGDWYYLNEIEWNRLKKKSVNN